VEERAMSRSRRKTPIGGVTTAGSEKQDKRDYKRRYRRVAKQAVEAGDESKPLPILREHSDPWSMNKDGKMLFDPRKNACLLRK